MKLHNIYIIKITHVRRFYFVFWQVLIKRHYINIAIKVLNLLWPRFCEIYFNLNDFINILITSRNKKEYRIFIRNIFKKIQKHFSKTQIFLLIWPKKHEKADKTRKNIKVRKSFRIFRFPKIYFSYFYFNNINKNINKKERNK